MKCKLFFVLLFFIHPVFSETGKLAIENIDADHPFIQYIGRIDFSNPKAPRFSWPGITIKATFEGKVCNIRMNDFGTGTDSDGKLFSNYYQVIIDNVRVMVLKCEPSKSIYKIDSLSEGKHTIVIVKRTEGSVGETKFLGFQLEKGKKLWPIAITEKVRRMEFIGNSITCGYGNEGTNKECKFSAVTENNYMAYGAITARALNAAYCMVAFSGKGIYKNYDGTTEETLPMIYDRTLTFDENIKWDFKKYIPDVVVINLGTNDFAHSNPDSAAFVSRYYEFVKTIRKNYPQAYIFCINGPMMSDQWPIGSKALSTLKRYVNGMVDQFNKSGDGKVYSFYLSQQGSFGYGCDWHPNVRQHIKSAGELTKFIKEKTGWE
jgi:lysophospholipase L1-like esterase